MILLTIITIIWGLLMCFAFFSYNNHVKQHKDK
ncbi:holin [Rhodobacteraceae phage LS06-2018-MD05]|nr:holin [Rhodobacteraceae phage LS06-2018-MD05]